MSFFSSCTSRKTLQGSALAVGNDQMSSIKKSGTFSSSVSLWEHSGCSGKKLNTSSSISNLNDKMLHDGWWSDTMWNDQVTSYKCSKPSNGGNWIAYQHKDYNGGSTYLRCDGVCHNISESFDCKRSGWTAEGGCSKSCGGGEQKFTRVVTDAAVNNGSCSGSNTKTEPCNTQACPVDCQVTEWAEGACSHSCGGGDLTATRQITQQPMHGGQACPATQETRACNAQPCAEIPVKVHIVTANAKYAGISDAKYLVVDVLNERDEWQRQEFRSGVLAKGATESLELTSTGSPKAIKVSNTSGDAYIFSKLSVQVGNEPERVLIENLTPESGWVAGFPGPSWVLVSAERADWIAGGAQPALQFDL